jgi:hypothetical protein
MADSLHRPMPENEWAFLRISIEGNGLRIQPVNAQSILVPRSKLGFGAL